MGKRTLPKKSNNQAPPVSEVLFHLLRLEADWKVEPPPLHPMEREVRKSLKIGKSLWLLYRRWKKRKTNNYITDGSGLPPCSFQHLNKHVSCVIFFFKVHQYLDLKVAKGISVLPNLFQIGRAQLLSDWTTQATKQHGGDSLFH